MEIVSNKLVDNDTGYIAKNELESSLSNQFADKDVKVSYRRPGEEYQYIVTIGDTEYGIKENNEVELLTAEIRNQYIEVTEVKEETPVYVFQNVVKQEDVDGEANASNVAYSIIGVATSEDGEYISSGNVEGKSGYLSIVDLQEANFEYTLNKFFQGDEVFYVKIQIGDNLEKIQKLTVIQGDIVRYEENFAGIEYTGTWNNIEDEMFCGGTAKFTETLGDSFSFDCFGKAIGYVVYSDENAGFSFNNIYEINEDGTKKSLIAWMIDFNYNETQIKGIVNYYEGTSGWLYFDKNTKSSLKVNVNLRNAKRSATSTEKTITIDSILVCK